MFFFATKICQTRKFLQFSKAALFIYDDGLLGDDRELANAVWRRFYSCTEDPKPAEIEILVSYVRRTMSLLDNVDMLTLLGRGAIKWLDIEDVAKSVHKV